MYYLTKKSHLMTINQITFANVIHVNDKSVAFDFYYNVNIPRVFKEKAYVCRVSIVSRNVPQPNIVPTGDKDNGTLYAQNIRKRVTRAKTSYTKMQQYTLTSRKSNILAYISDGTITELSKDVKIADLERLYAKKLHPVSVAEIKQSDANVRVMSRVAYRNISDSVNNVPDDFKSPFYSRMLMLDMIVKMGMDPSYVSQMNHRSVTAKMSVGGLLRRHRSKAGNDPEHSRQTRLLYSYIFSPDIKASPTQSNEVADGEKVLVLSKTFSSDVEVPVRLKLRRSAIADNVKNGFRHQVRFELLKVPSGVVVERIERPIEIDEHIKMFVTPKKPPVMNVAPGGDTGKMNITINASEKNVRGFTLYKKVVHNAVTDIDDYARVTYYGLKPGSRDIKIPVRVPINSSTLYRAVAHGDNGTRGFEFTNVVVRPKKFSNVKSIALSAKITQNGIRIEARKLPPDVTAIQFIVKDKTRHEKNYRFVNTMQVIGRHQRSIDSVAVIDSGVKDQHVYEYATRLSYRGGEVTTVGGATIEFIKTNRGKVDTRVTDVVANIENGEPNVRFNISTNILDKDMNVIQLMLMKQDIYDHFENDIKVERDRLQDLIAHNVQRVDLTSGERDDFGIVVGDNFVDRDHAKINAVPMLKIGHKYRYEVTALLRDAETLFEKFEKTVVDPVTKRPYTFRPHKFLQPITMRTGTLVSTRGLKTQYAKSDMMQGNIGNFEFVDVSFETQPASITTVEAKRFDRDLNRITWTITGAINMVDHFIIIKDVLNVRTIIGKTHSEFDGGSCQYMHSITDDDMGEIKYVIIPIFNDYSSGVPIVSNRVVI